MIRAGLGEPLVLMHGVGGGPAYWREVMPLLAPHHDTIALCALGHRHGPVPPRRPARIVDVFDAAERQLDALGIETAHLVGCSMGGLMALELARRGRARSVCAFSPGGMWTGEAQHRFVRELLLASDRENRMGWPLRAIMVRSARVRRHGMRLACESGDRVMREQALEFAQDWHDCTVLQDLLDDDWAFDVFDPLPCPVSVVWAEHDKVLPLATDGASARELVPAAEHIVLDGVGHVSMLDDPSLVADTILAVTARAGRAAEPAVV